MLTSVKGNITVAFPITSVFFLCLVWLSGMSGRVIRAGAQPPQLQTPLHSALFIFAALMQLRSRFFMKCLNATLILSQNTSSPPYFTHSVPDMLTSVFTSWTGSFVVETWLLHQTSVWVFVRSFTEATSQWKKHPVLWQCGRKLQEQSSLTVRLVSDGLSLVLSIGKKSSFTLKLTKKEVEAVICNFSRFSW